MHTEITLFKKNKIMKIVHINIVEYIYVAVRRKFIVLNTFINESISKAVKKQAILYIADENTNLYSHLGGWYLIITNKIMYAFIS